MDPVMSMWTEVRDAERQAVHPPPAIVAVAARTGADLIDDAARNHLLGGRCDRCEAILTSIWAKHPPHPLLIAQSAEWPGSSALIGALAAYRSRAAQQPDDPVSAPSARPSLTSRLRSALGERGATLRDVFAIPSSGIFVPATGMNNQTAQRDAPPAAPDDAEAGVVLAEDPAALGHTLLTIDFDLLVHSFDGPALAVIIASASGEVLAHHGFAEARGRQTVSVAVDPALIASGDLAVAIGSIDE